MAGLWYKSATNVWSKAKGVHYKNASNVWTKAKGLRYKNATNVWSGNVLQTFDVSYQMGNGSYTNGLITLSNPSVGQNSVGLTFNMMVDVTSYSQIRAVVDYTTSGSSARSSFLSLFNQPTGSSDNYTTRANPVTLTNNSTITLNTEGYNGSFYLRFHANLSGSTATDQFTARLKEIYVTPTGGSEQLFWRG